MYVRERGDGPPLLLINGIGGNADMWGPLEDRLTRRSLARSSSTPPAPAARRPRGGRSASPATRDVAAALLDELGHDRVDVLGFSFGGLVAQELARRRPERVRRLALVSTACGWGSKPGTLASLALISMPFRYHSRAVYERTNRLLSPADHGLVHRLPHLAEARLRHPPPLLGYGYQLEAGMFWTSLPWLHTVQAPTLVLAGGLDHLVPPANGVQLARLLPTRGCRSSPRRDTCSSSTRRARASRCSRSSSARTSSQTRRRGRRGRVVDDDAEVEACVPHLDRVEAAWRAQ